MNLSHAHPSRRLLLVEDDPISQEIMSQLLSQAGLDFSLAGNGQEAIRLCEQERFGLVLMDCQMPVMDGWQATRALREMERRKAAPRCPIVAMTANKGAASDAAYREAGFDDALEKPLTPSVLNTLLQRLDGDSTDLMPGAGNPPAQVSSNAASGTDSPIDTQEIQKLANLLGPALPHLIGTYIENGKKLLTEIAHYYRHQDCTGLAASAHALRGSSRTITARRVESMAAEIERQGRSGDLPTPSSLVLLVTEFEHVTFALAAVVESQFTPVN